VIRRAITTRRGFSDSVALMRLSILAVTSILVVAAPAADAQSRTSKRSPTEGLSFGIQDGGQYARCLSRARQEPAKAFDDAKTWRARGGGAAARHCAAVAMLVGGEAASAGEELEALARELRDRPARLRAELLSQAAFAWLLARQDARAARLTNEAIAIDADNIDLRLDRAELHAANKRYWEAIDDLNYALERNPQRSDALVLRALAHRLLDADELAADDVERALAIAPRYADAFLERGMLARKKGDIAAARRDFLQVLINDPDGLAGDAARAQIEAMETRPGGARQAPRR
jgi:tetratricopeptide (TPR) repeat protein